jgi:hypothetical protein
VHDNHYTHISMGIGHKKGKSMATKRTRAALKRARRDQSEGLSKSCSAITDISVIEDNTFNNLPGPRFLCSATAFVIFNRAVGRQRALHKENSGFASPTLGRHISTFCGYRILFCIINPYINRFTNHLSFHS